MPSVNVKSITRAARRLVGAESLSEQLERRRSEAFQTWREAVKAHAAGQQFDLDAIAVAASLIGIASGKIAMVLDADAAAWREGVDLAKSAEAARVHGDEAEARAKVAAAELDAARERYERLTQEASAGVWAMQAWGYAERDALAHRRRHPRLWPNDHLDGPDALAEAVRVHDEGDAPAPAPRRPSIHDVPVGEAAFVDDE
jgi:hypothetical protein